LLGISLGTNTEHLKLSN